MERRLRRFPRPGVLSLPLWGAMSLAVAWPVRGSSAADVSGTVHSYATASLGQLDPVGGALVNAELTPPVSTTADERGGYAITGVADGSNLTLSVSVPEPLSFRPTRNETAMPVHGSVELPLHVVAVADLQRWYTTATRGRSLPDPDPGGVLVAELQRDDGLPLAGVQQGQIRLLDAAGRQVVLDPAADGPFFFGATGDPLPPGLQPTSATHSGVARLVIFDLPPGRYSVLVEHVAAGGASLLRMFAVETSAGGVTLARLGHRSSVALAGSPTFAADIHPMLQRASRGGIGCANCHTAAGQAPMLQFDRAADEVLAALIARPGVLELLAAPQSQLLSKPLYEEPANHPSATFASPTDPAYQRIRSWIESGAPP